MWKLLTLSMLITSAYTMQTKYIDQNKVIEQHNIYRKELGIPPLKFSQECADFAQKWAEKLAKNNRGLVHSKQAKFGENIFWKSKATNETEIIDAWAREKKYFSNRKRKYNSKNGHYTQMIWENTKLIGTGMAISKDGSEYWVCTYYPPGNWIGEKAYK